MRRPRRPTVLPCTAALLVLAGCAASSSAPRSQAGAFAERAELPIPEDLRREIELAEAIGVELYLLDHVAAIGTDVLREKVGAIEGLGLGGYLPLREGDDTGQMKNSFLITFFTAERPPRVAYQVRLFTEPERQAELEAFDPPEPRLWAFHCS